MTSFTTLRNVATIQVSRQGCVFREDYAQLIFRSSTDSSVTIVLTEDDFLTLKHALKTFTLESPLVS